MPTIYFKFNIDDIVYLIEPQGGCCASSHYKKRTVVSLSRYKGINYYELNDGNKLEEEYLHSVAEYEAYLANERLEVAECAEKKLENL